MSEDQDDSHALRARRRNSENGSQGGNGANGGSHEDSESRAGGQQWGWTRPRGYAREEEAPQAEADADREHSVLDEEQPRKRLTYDQHDRSPKPASDVVKLPFDPWRLVAAARRRWAWLVIGSLLFGGIGFWASGKIVKYKVSLNLMRRQMDSAVFTDSVDAGRAGGRQLSDATIYAFMRSGGLLARVAERASTNNPPVKVTGKQLSEMVGVQPTPNPDLLVISMSGTKNSPNLAVLLNVYADEVSRFTREIQSAEARQIALILSNRVAAADEELTAASQELVTFQKQAGLVGTIEKENENHLRTITEIDTKIAMARMEMNMLESSSATLQKVLAQQSPVIDRAKSLREEYERNKASLTDLHPTQVQLKRQIEIMEKSTNNIAASDGPSSSNPMASALFIQAEEAKGRKSAYERQIADLERQKEAARKQITGLSDKTIEYGELKARIQSLTASRDVLASKERDTRLFVDNAMGFYKVIGEASAEDIDWKGRVLKVAILTLLGASAGFLLSLTAAFFCEAIDTTLKTAIDIERTTDLKVIAALGDINKMSEVEKDEWAFTTLTLLRGKLCRSLDGGMVCGFISSDPGEGCSTWVNLLRKAGREMGFTVYTPPSDEKAFDEEEPDFEEAANQDANGNHVVRQPKLIPATASEGNMEQMAVATVPKASMAMIDRAARGIWDAEARQKLRNDLERERRKMNNVMLIDLPPASSREGILLAQRFPQLIWLTRSGMADVKKTREQLKMLKAAKCKIVGAVLNQAPAPPLNARLARWFKWSTSMFALSFGLVAIQAQDKPAVSNQPEPQPQAPVQPQPTETKLAFSATALPKRAQWQQRLTLGPGDAMDISLYGQPTLTRTNLFIGPDGRISYLQAQGIVATGMTIEELRERLDQELSKYYNSPRTMVVPVSFVSKKYYVLGKVMQKGVYPLDRPLTVVEAVARAQGLETGLYDRSSVDLADLSRSFLVRNGERAKVDFEKLFLEGDLTQNVSIEPDDFLYFASSAAREIYVFGEVAAPGPLGYVGAATLMTALADRGGFTDRAYKGKVLVIRGSLNNPETYVVNAKAIFEASEKDFKLESRDIIYVAHRPWIRAEELLDEAAQSFIQGFVTAFSGFKIGPFIRNPIFGD